MSDFDQELRDAPTNLKYPCADCKHLGETDVDAGHEAYQKCHGPTPIVAHILETALWVTRKRVHGPFTDDVETRDCPLFEAKE